MYVLVVFRFDFRPDQRLFRVAALAHFLDTGSQRGRDASLAAAQPGNVRLLEAQQIGGLGLVVVAADGNELFEG